MIVKLVKVQILPHFIVENDAGMVTSEVAPKQPLDVYANELAQIQELVHDIQDRITRDALAPKS